jgi:CheY-like chemotaxis protein
LLLGNFLQFVRARFILWVMTQPLALVLYEKLLPGTQLVNRLQDLKYRVRAVTDPQTLEVCARQEKPMLILADLVSTRVTISNVIGQLRQNPETQHIPVIAFAPEDQVELQESARKTGATLVVSETAILNHLPQFLDQALQVE